MVELRVESLSIAYEEKIIVEDLNLTIPKGKITVLVGSNGSGKSTILKAIARILYPINGGVYLDGKSIHHEPSKSIARKLAILPQSPLAPEGLTVRELVSYGRTPYQKGFRSLSAQDHEMIEWALMVTGMAEFANRPVDRLSGGQRQRAWIAMAVAQGTDLLLLDEPTTFLDMAHQLEVLKLLQKLNVTENRTILMVVHDLNHATRFADHIVAIKKGKKVCEGTPHTVMSPDVIKTVFGIDADILIDPRTGVPLCIPYNIAKANEL